MKKLLVAAMGATAAFGAFAYTNAVRFGGEAGDKTAVELNALARSWNDTATGTYVAAPADTAGTNQYAIAAFSGSVPAARPLRDGAFTQNPTTELSVKTQFGKPLEFYVDPTAPSTGMDIDGLYFDSLVKFTVCDDDLQQAYDDAKIVMWLQETTNTTGDVVGTNIMVKAGYLSKANNAVAVEPKVYTCNAVTGDFADKWHRVTIKAIADITADGETDVPAFAIYINGGNSDATMFKEVATLADRLDGSFDYTLTDAAAYLDGIKTLFPSMKQGTATGVETLSCVAFDGTGYLNDLVVTDQLPGDFAKDHEAKKATYVVGNVTNSVETLEEMVSDVNSYLASGSSVSVTLLKGMTIATPLEFTGSGTLTLDFAGVVLTNENSYAAITNSAATLIITNSVGNGGIYCTGWADQGYPAEAICNSSSSGKNMTIQDGVFWGCIVVDDWDEQIAPGIVISGGLFTDGGVAPWLDHGKRLDPYTSDLYVVVDILPVVYYTVTVETPTHASVAVATNGVTIGTAGGVYENCIEAGSDVTVVYTADTGYELTGTAEYSFSAIAAPQSTKAPTATLITYTVTFNKNSEDATGTMTDQVIDYGAATALTANAFTRDGYDFAGWATSAMGEVVYADEGTVTLTSAGLTLYAKWNVKTFTVTFNANDENATGTMSDQTFTYNVAQTLTANAFAVDGKDFSGWNTESNGSGTEYTNEQSVTLTAAGLTLYAQWTQQSSDPIPPVSPEADSATVNAAVDEAGFTDSAVKALISGDATKYNSFKSWADSVSGGEKAVVNSAHAAVSFQLSPIVQSATLFENTPVLKFTKIEPTASSTSWDVTVELKDGEDKTVQLKAAAADFATRVWKGSSLSNMTQCSASDVTAAVQDADGKKVTLTVTPPSGTSGFIKIKAE